jgi:hypothetical protein
MFEHGLCVGQTGEVPSPKNPIGYLSGHGLCALKNAQAASSAIPHVLDQKSILCSSKEIELDENAAPTPNGQYLFCRLHSL